MFAYIPSSPEISLDVIARQFDCRENEFANTETRVKIYKYETKYKREMKQDREIVINCNRKGEK